MKTPRVMDLSTKPGRDLGALAGGGSSPVRAGAAVGGAPFVQRSGRGAYALGIDGHTYVDYVMAYGPLLFGHAHPAFSSGLDELAARGTVYGSTTEEEVRLADRIAAHLPSMERMRFVNTGTEAMMSAIRVARAFTGRTLVARFAGNYHGHFDGALHDAGASAGTGSAARSGIPVDVQRMSIVARFNDLADLDVRLAGRETDLAAILVEPVVGNMGLVLAQAGFLDGLFARAREYGALVIFDEVITWLRLGLAGGQGFTGHLPDLTAIGKAMGGGFPLAAFGGRADVMAALAPNGSSFTGGTFSGNPFAIAMGHRTLDFIEADPGMFARLNARSKSLADGFREIFTCRALPYAVVQLASMVDFAFRPGPAVRNFEERSQADRNAFAAYYHAMRERHILLAPSPNELMFLSTQHGKREIDATLEAADAALATLQRDGLIYQRQEICRRRQSHGTMSTYGRDEILKRLESLPGWHHRGNTIEKHFDRANFDGSMAFVNAVAKAANELDHHPDISISWNEVTLTLSSHDVAGITGRDFALAAAIEELAKA